LEPVQLAGTIVKRASFNADQIEKDIRLGDTVFVEKEERLSLKL
jgi:NAD-dependent DNA ligase